MMQMSFVCARKGIEYRNRSEDIIEPGCDVRCNGRRNVLSGCMHQGNFELCAAKSFPEMLDEDVGTAAEVETSLNDLRHINDWFGGTRTTVRLLQQVIAHHNRRQLSLLEV